MRRAAVFIQQERANAFSLRLKKLGLESEIETLIDVEPHQYVVWTILEDDFPKALEELRLFEENQDALKKGKVEPAIPPLFETLNEKQFDELRPGKTIRQEIARLSGLNSAIRMNSLCTKLILVFSLLVYFTSVFQKIELVKITSPSLLAPLISPVEGYFLYEYPKILQLNDELIREYHYKDENELSQLPPDGAQLVKQIEENPFWGGFYGEMVAKLQKIPVKPHLLFQDIRNGQIWRIISPIFLHSDLLHILFNMLWLWLLGRVIEVRLGAFRYIGMIVVIAAVSNTLQYLVSGPFFMGFSGVITGMAGYIWMREIIHPLEVYPIHKGAINFLWVFIIAMFLLQCLAFFLQIFNIVVLDLRIANTAHLSGAIVGMLLARLPIFRPVV
jgi:GlpG protein